MIEGNSNDAGLVKENGRLRKEIATYQNTLEAVEVRAKLAEKELKRLQKKFWKAARLLKEIGE